MDIYDIDIKCHQQDTDYYCSAASAQMILRSMRNGIIDQAKLYSDGHNNNCPGKWGSFEDPLSGLHGIVRAGGVDPTGLECALNINGQSFTNLPIGIIDNKFNIHEEIDQDQLMYEIVTNLINSKTPIAVLVKQASHWVVARGAHIDGDPNRMFTLHGVIINDPSPPLPYNIPQGDKLPPPHMDNDICGTVGDTIQSSDEYIATREWLDEWLTPVAFRPYSIPTTVAVYNEPQIMVKLGNLVYYSHKFIPEENRIIDTEILSKITLEQAKIHGLFEHKIYANALQGARPSKPILVQRLDKLDSFYYIVPMVREGMITSTALVHAVDGTLQGFVPLDKPTEKLYFDHEAVIKKLTERPIYMEDSGAKLMFREGTFSIHPIMVWKLCKESLSKYRPFHMVTIGNTQIYVGWDGKVYTKLHDPGRFG